VHIGKLLGGLGGVRLCLPQACQSEPQRVESVVKKCEANYVIIIADKKSAASRSVDFVLFLHKRLVMIT
jgi:hypothetical protein